MKRPRVEFVLSDPQGSSAIYKTDDIIDGEILFTPHRQVKVENVTISLQGIMRMEVENMYTHIPVSTNVLEKPFLRMDFPVFDGLFDTILESGKMHHIPFKFVVPQQLPVQVCHHECANFQIQQEHLQLPASLGTVSRLLNAGDDMAPKTSQINYYIKFEVWDSDALKGCQAKKTQEALCPVYILPTRQESAPLLTSHSKYYKLQTEKNLGRGILSSSIGALIASVAQPPAIQLHNLQPEDASIPLKFNLRFEPTHEGQLPPNHLSTQFKLKAFTFYGVEPWHKFPDLKNDSTMGPQQALCMPLRNMNGGVDTFTIVANRKVCHTGNYAPWHYVAMYLIDEAYATIWKSDLCNGLGFG
ncbi:hypothetical protein N7448_001992 [Penicillium atrosanguineum]|uniref:Arrestin-like N-terminal domain-containing protein n=1 Tax=Penicillium atrosanguineum TaxID=1132637 RepID=A0A9W9PTK9_9EURO|nr:hypothetical protein N7526_006441 [Penicillium atrosanguineum]KAJ5144600.1 hypothetical protein N7448_001992 [Penicillium atrosanguineum]KAJ5311030.1 hypothetical protein N7476_006890 [Penicillium atrosanguineum]